MAWLLGTTLGRSILSVAAVSVLWFGWLFNHDRKVESRVIAKIEQGNSINVEKAKAVRRTVETLPADQLDDRFRRD